MAEAANTPGATGGPGVGPVAPANPVAKPGLAPSGVSTPASVKLFGGNRGGRKRADGLAPGSPEAVEADKKKDRERKQASRTLVEPPPLPSAAQSSAGQATTPGSGVLPGPGAESVEAPIPWDPEVLRPMVEEAVSAMEEKRVSDFSELASQAALGADLVREIEKDAHYHPAFKKTVNSSTPRVLAKWLNRSPISGKYSDEAMLGAAAVMLWFQGRSITSRLEKLIEERKKAAEPLPPSAPAAQLATPKPALPAAIPKKT